MGGHCISVYDQWDRFGGNWDWRAAARQKSSGVEAFDRTDELADQEILHGTFKTTSLDQSYR